MKTAADIMTSPVVTVTPETSVKDVADLLAGQRYGSVPVADVDGRLLGIVSEEDMVMRAAEVHLPRHVSFLGGIIYFENPQHFIEEAEKILALTARDIMDPIVAFVQRETPVPEIAARMLAEDLRRLFVLDADHHLLGLITRADIVRMLATGAQLPE